MKSITNVLLLLYSVMVLGLTLALGMSAMLTKSVENYMLIIVAGMWILLYGWIQYKIKEMQ